MKKKRGLKRYYKSLDIQNEFTKLKRVRIDYPSSLIPHIHFDRHGYGNNSFKRRKPHLDKLFRHFEYLVDELYGSQVNFQLYAVLLDKSSSSDALFFNEHCLNNQILFKITDLSAQSTLTNKKLQSYLDALKGYNKLYGTANEAFCLIVKQGVGEPL